jgi:hypothetical protein
MGAVSGELSAVGYYTPYADKIPYAVKRDTFSNVGDLRVIGLLR